MSGPVDLSSVHCRHWARHVGQVPHWRSGVIRVLCSRNPLSYTGWKAIAGADCPVPPGWGTLSPSARRKLAQMVQSQPPSPSLPPSRESAIRRFRLHQAKLESQRSTVEPFASRVDERYAMSCAMAIQEAEREQLLTDVAIVGWAAETADRAVRGPVDLSRVCREIADQLEAGADVAGLTRVVFGHNAPVPELTDEERPSADALRRAAGLLRAVQPRLAPAAIATREATSHDRAAARAAERRELLRQRFPQPFDWEDLAADDTEPEWLIQGFLLAGGQAHLSAPAKTGKSMLALWIAANLAVGRDPFTWADREPITVAYLDFEMSRLEVKQRLLKGMGFTPPQLEKLRYHLRPLMPPLDTAEGGEWMSVLVEMERPQLVVIDTLSRVTEGGENDSDTYRNLYRHSGQVLKDAGVALIRLDHEGHGDTRRARGSSAKSDDVDVIWSMGRLDSNGLKLVNKGDRSGHASETVKLVRTQSPPLGFRLETNAVTLPKGTKEKADELDVAGVPLTATKSQAIAALKAAGFKQGGTDVLLAALKFRRAAFDDAATYGPEGDE